MGSVNLFWPNFVLECTKYKHWNDCQKFGTRSLYSRVINTKLFKSDSSSIVATHIIAALLMVRQAQMELKTFQEEILLLFLITHGVILLERSWRAKHNVINCGTLSKRILVFSDETHGSLRWTKEIYRSSLKWAYSKIKMVRTTQGHDTISVDAAFRLFVVFGDKSW
jgi:hypothetical protein